ncbi:MAG: universal stress protein [Candidatus Cyclobacteriaceae bacterium M2_1C_046]
MKNILVPTDLSDVAENGLKVAVDIAKRVHGKIHLVNFIKHPFGRTFSATGDIYTKYADQENLFTVQLIRKHKEELNELVEKYKEEGFTIKASVYDEELDDGIDPVVEEYAIDLIVMGTTGEANAKEKFTGNHAEQVIQEADCPVLSIREDYRLQDMHHVVLGWDLDDDKDYNKAITYINELSDALKARLDIVYVVKPGTRDKEKISEELKRSVSDYNLTNFTLHIVEDSDTEDGIINYAHKVQAGIIVMLTKAQSGVARFFSHSSTEEMSRESNIPVFTVNLHNV